jgi:hypothetical protein
MPALVGTPVLDAEQHAGLGVDCAAFRHDRGARDRQIAQLRKREYAEHQRHQRQAVGEVERVQRPAHLAALRLLADHGEHDADTGGREPAQRRIARERRDHGNAAHRKGEQFRRADIEHQRLQDRQAHAHQRRAEQPAHQGRHIGRAERAAGLALAGERIAVERRRRRSGMTRHAEQDGADRIGGRRRRAEPEQQRGGRVRIELICEGQHQRGAGDPADARQEAEAEPHAHAGEQIDQPMRVEDD